MLRKVARDASGQNESEPDHESVTVSFVKRRSRSLKVRHPCPSKRAGPRLDETTASGLQYR
jgi:hypothetical protein